MRSQPFSAQAAVWLYLLTFALPLDLDIGLLGLAFLGGWTALACAPRFPSGALVALFPVALAIGMGNLTGLDPDRSLHLSLALIPACVVYLLICGYFELRQLVRLCLILTLMVCGIGGWLLTIAVGHPESLPDEWIRQSHLTALKAPNDVVLFQILLPFSLALLQLQPRFSPKSWIALTAIVIAVLVAVVYRSRLAVLIAGTSSVTFFALQRETKHLLPAVLILTLGIVLADALFGFALLEKFSNSWTSRLPLWQAAWRMFLASPWIGHGVGSYALLYRDYLDLAHLPAWIVFDPRPAPWAHNLYLEVLAETGVLGLTALLFLLVFPLRRQPKHLPNSHVQTFACAGKAAWLAFALSACFELSLWRQWVGLTFLLIIGWIGATNKLKEGEP